MRYATDREPVHSLAGVRRAVFCGHSMALALKVAVRRPDLAAGVVLLDGALLLRPEAQQGIGQLVQALDTDACRDALLGFFARAAGPAADRVRVDVSAAPRCYAAPVMRDILDSEPRVIVRTNSQQCPAR